MNDPPTSPRSGRVLLPILILLSGFCGISYEILYAKLLGNILGNQFIINATVLLTFLLGIGVGTFFAHRFNRWLWAIEAGIGLYAAAMAAGQGLIDRTLYAWVPFLGTNILICALVCFALLSVPAFLIGCSLPLFAGYLSSLRSTRVFSVTYGIYNVGAGLTALTIEFVLLRSVGLRAATITLALLNVVVATALLLLVRSTPVIPRPTLERIRFPRSAVAGLAVASVGSAVFQLLMVKLAEFLFGPFNETFALVLATVLLGIAAGSLLAGRFGLPFHGVLYIALGGLVWMLAVLPVAVRLYATLYPTAATHYPLLVLLKFSLVLALMGLPAVGFGATIPALLSTHKNLARESGLLLFFSSMANVFGFILMAFVLHRFLDYGPILLFITALTVAAVLIQQKLRPRSAVAACTLGALAVLAFFGAWNETLLYVGHTRFHSLEKLDQELGQQVFADRFKGPQDVFAIVWKNDIPFFFINGYISIPIRGENASEKLVGAMSAMLAPRLDEALVLGMGSGATAGSVGVIFERTDVVEINKVVLQNIDKMAEYNFNVGHLPGVNIIHDDGIHHMKTTPKRYSLIVNTVTTPLYFSSSKLYTRDFLREVSKRLTPDGVYVTWVDGRIGDRGIDIILETLGDTFPECWMYYLDATYLLMSCSNEVIRARQIEQVAAVPELRQPFTEEHSLDLHTLPYSVISTRTRQLEPPRGAPINTTDFPILEFEMSKLQSLTPLAGFKDRLYARGDLALVRRDLSLDMNWDPAEFTVFTDTRLGKRSRLRHVLRELTREQFGPVDDDAYVRIALEQARNVGTAPAFMKYGHLILDRDAYAAAATAFGEALRLDPDTPRVRYYVGRALAGQHDYEQALRWFDEQWRVDADAGVPGRAADVLIRLERFDEARRWLALVPDEDRDAGYFYDRGRVAEGLGEPAAAIGEYEHALRRNAEHRRSRDALARLRGPQGAVAGGNR